MSKRWTVTCSACKFYNFPLYCIGTSGFHAKPCQLKKPYTCICVKMSEKGKNDVDSLSSLKNKRNCNDLDDKIKNLKSELTSLVKEESKPEMQNNININNNNTNNNNKLNAKNIRACSVIKHVHKSYQKNVSCSGGRVDVKSNHVMHKDMKPDTHSKKKDFTNWLDSTIDSLSGTPNSDGNNSKQTPAGKNKTFHTVVDENAECLIETNYLTQDWDDLKIAQELLYESFLMQNYPCYMTPVNDKVEALPMNLTKRKHERTEGRKLAKKTKTSDKKQNLDPTKQENDNMTGWRNQNRSDSEVEVINIDDDSNNSSSEIKKVDCDEDTQKVIVIEDNDTNPEIEAIEKENSDSKKRVWECPICFEQNTGQEIVTTMCGHVFCKKCLEDYYVTHKQSCPTCRTNLHDKPLITLFNF